MSKQKRTWGNWKEKKHFGQGGAGTTYLVEKDNKEAILKLLTKQQNDRGKTDRFIKEIEILKSINHEENNGVIAILDDYQNYLDENLWYVIPKGIPCKEYLKKIKDPQNPFNYLLFIVRQAYLLFDTLEFLHKQQIAHRDIKPENIIWNEEKERFIFIDFGIAKNSQYELEHGLNLTAEYDKNQLGPKSTMPPEMRVNPLKANPYLADIYSLTKTIWLMIVGEDFCFEGQYVEENHDFDFLLKKTVNPEDQSKILLFDWEKEILNEIFKTNTNDIPEKRLSIKETKEILDGFEILMMGDIGLKSSHDVRNLGYLNNLSFLIKQLFGENAKKSNAQFSAIDKKILNLLKFIMYFSKFNLKFQNINIVNDNIIMAGNKLNIKHIEVDYLLYEEYFINFHKIKIIISDINDKKYIIELDSQIFDYC